MDVCVVELLMVLIRRYMRLEANALVNGDHAHTLILDGLFFLFGYARLSLCNRTKTLEQEEMPDLEPMLSTLPETMQQAIRGAIAAEQDGHCIHEDCVGLFNQNVIESHYIWTIEEPPLRLQA